MSPACRNRSDRDTPSNAEPEREIVPQHSRDLEGDIRRPYEQPWQRDLRLRRRDDWYSDESDQESVSGAARTGNREPRYYHDGEIPASRMEVASSQQPHREPEVARHAALPDNVEFMNDAQHGFREKARSFNSTTVAHDVEPEDGICRLSSDRVVKANYSSDCTEVVTPCFSTLLTHSVLNHCWRKDQFDLVLRHYARSETAEDVGNWVPHFFPLSPSPPSQKVLTQHVAKWRTLKLEGIWV